jgi:acyl carrier protein
MRLHRSQQVHRIRVRIDWRDLVHRFSPPCQLATATPRSASATRAPNVRHKVLATARPVVQELRSMADRAAIFARIAELIEPHNKKGVAVAEGTSFADDLEFDSLTVMDLVAAMEDEWDIVIPLNMLPELETVGQVADAVHRLVSK